jgi:DDE family transposase
LPSNETIRKIINAEGYKLRKVQKTKPKKVPETDAIFDQIHRVNADADASEHDLRLSVDCKGAVKIGAPAGKPRLRFGCWLLMAAVSEVEADHVRELLSRAMRMLARLLRPR